MKMRSIRDLAAAVKGARTELGLSQAELALRAGVSRKWIYEFEAGKPHAEIRLLIRVLDALNLALEVTSAEPRHLQPGAGAVDLEALIDEHRLR